MKKEKILEILCIVLAVLLIITIIICVIGKRNNNNKVFDIDAATKLIEQKYNIIDETITYALEDDNYIIYGRDKDDNYKMFIVNKKTKEITEKDLTIKTG